MAIFPESVDDLPETIPVFPLQGALLLPRGKLPLNIFEPRYRAMVEDALGHDRVIGMIQPKVPEKQEPGDHPDLYGTGCLGKITTFGETDDGRFLITLTGLCRFDVAKELPAKRGYRRVAPDFAPWAGDLASPADDEIDRDRLLASIRAYLDRRSLSADWEAVEKTRTGDLVSVMSMVCPFSALEKQALLEAPTGFVRAETMMSLMDMDRAGDEPPDSVN